MKHLAVKGFEKFQHYRDRNPPWIKLYSTILTDLAFLEMPESAQSQLIKLWVLASQFGHPLPNNPRLLAGKIGTTGKFHLATMIAAGFLIPCEQNAINDASDDGADSEQSAMPSVRARGERTELESERESSSAAAAEIEAVLALMLESDSDRNALTAVVARANDKHACVQALHSVLTGNDPATPQPSPSLFGEALRDLATNGERMTARKFRNYLESAERRRAGANAPPTNASAAPLSGKTSIGTRAFVTSRAAIEDL